MTFWRRLFTSIRARLHCETVYISIASALINVCFIHLFVRSFTIVSLFIVVAVRSGHALCHYCALRVASHRRDVSCNIKSARRMFLCLSLTETLWLQISPDVRIVGPCALSHRRPLVTPPSANPTLTPNCLLPDNLALINHLLIYTTFCNTTIFNHSSRRIAITRYS